MSNLNAVSAELSDFIRAISAYRLLAHRAAAEQLGLTLTDLRCLDAVRTIPNLTPSRLSVVIGLSASATTTALDRLEAQGLLERTRDSADRRRINLRSTGEHETHTARLFAPLTDVATRLLAAHTEPELKMFADLLHQLTRASLTAIQQQVATPTQTGN